MTIWLKDFPQNAVEYRALLSHNQSIHGVYIIEEQFLKNEEEEVILGFSHSDPAMIALHEE